MRLSVLARQSAVTSLGLVLPVVLLAACSGGNARGQASTARSTTATPSQSASAPSQSASSSTPAPRTSASTSTAAAPTVAADPAREALDRLSLAQRVGQLFMVAASDTGPDPAAAAVVRDHAVGSVILMGSSRLSVDQTARLTAALQAAAVPGVPLLIATDQEGGEVQRLRGPGFGAIPSAVEQSQSGSAALQQSWTQWAGALRRAGITVDLAPVADTVPAGVDNPPIGELDRQYGSTPQQTAGRVTAVVTGMQAAGVQATVKHFPGLGRVSANTDYAGNVVDSVTVRHDPYLAPFAAGMSAGAFVMVSTAVYARIDPAQPAAFSSTVIGGMLRGDLGFTGVIMTDDVGEATQVADISPPQRALRFLIAGGDIVLTVVAEQIPAMTAAVIARAQTDPGFRAMVDAAALRVLRAKQRLALVR